MFRFRFQLPIAIFLIKWDIIALENEKNMVAISLDLRQRIVDSYEQGEGSIRDLAIRFKVCKNTVFSLIQQYRLTGTIAPKAVGGCKPKLNTTENLPIIERILLENSDATLAELCKLFSAKTDQAISISSMFRLIRKLGWTRKKKQFMHQNKKLLG
jgi:transposase